MTDYPKEHVTDEWLEKEHNRVIGVLDEIDLPKGICICRDKNSFGFVADVKNCSDKELSNLKSELLSYGVRVREVPDLDVRRQCAGIVKRVPERSPSLIERFKEKCGGFVWLRR